MNVAARRHLLVDLPLDCTLEVIHVTLLHLHPLRTLPIVATIATVRDEVLTVMVDTGLLLLPLLI